MGAEGAAQSGMETDVTAAFEPNATLGISARTYTFVFLAVFSVAIAFALYTNHAWEDYYITYRTSKNLATGNGLVFQPGERVHTFTSPLGVLIPALLSAATGNRSDDLVLWLFRILSAAAFATTAILMLRAAARLSRSRTCAAFLVGMLAIDAKTVDFSINGMETGLMVMFLALTLNAMIAPGRFPALQLGLAWAGLMWTRPDSFVYIGGLCLGFLVFNADPIPARSRKTLVRLFVQAGLITAVLYLPWLIWAWTYYGSPIPHTVVAKGLKGHGSGLDMIASAVLYPVLSVFRRGAFAGVFLPPYAASGGWPYWLTIWSRVLAWSSAIAWIFPVFPSTVRAVSLGLMVAGFYLDEVSPFPYPWYLPSCFILAMNVLPAILEQLPRSLQRRVPRGPRVKVPARILAHANAALSMVLIGVSLSLTLAAAYQLRVQQQVIEAGNRKQIGLWLASHASSRTDTVFLEPLGYIGFYSGLRMLDFPGLSSPEVVAARKRLGSDSATGLIRALKPDWLVLRKDEAASIGSCAPSLLTVTYAPAKVFDVSDRVRSHQRLPGRSYLIKDQTYTIFRHWERGSTNRPLLR